MPPRRCFATLWLSAVVHICPTCTDVPAVIDGLADSARGPDGARYSAWRAGRPDAVDATYDVVQSMCRGECQAGLHHALCMFLPRSVGTPDGSILSEKTRPVALKDIGVKVATIVLSRAFASVTAASAVPEIGFIGGL